jgi:hypothetical protein
MICPTAKAKYCPSGYFVAGPKPAARKISNTWLLTL